MSSRSSMSDKETLLADADEKRLSFDGYIDDEVEFVLCSRSRLLAMGCTLWGVQLVWCTVFARGTTYLLSIGIPKSATPLLWVAGPLSGMIVQPVFGALSDDFRPQPGCSRRKPFILVGTLATVASMMGLAWIPDTVAAFQAIASEDACEALRLILAFIWVYALNVSLQPLQGGIRTMLFESCPKQQQVQVASWNSILTAIGNVCGYLLGSLSLQGMGVPLISSMSEFQALCTIISALLLLSMIITCLCPNENTLAVSEKSHYGLERKGHRGSIISRAVLQNLGCWRSLPEDITLVFQIQFFSWLGWFPVFYYQTAYLADLYVSMAHSKKLGTNATLMLEAADKASYAALPFALVALTTALVLTLIVPRTDTRHRHSRSTSADSIRRLVTFWLFGHLLFAATMLSTGYVSTIAQGTVLLATIGISRTLTAWVPFAIIGKGVSLSRHAGTLTSLHNAVMSAPQILASGMCALLFLLARSMGRRDDTVWAMWMAGCAAIMAAWKTFQLQKILAL